MRIASIIILFLIAFTANAQRQRVANLEISPDSTEAWAIYTDTNGVQTYVKWDSILFDIFSLDSSAAGSAVDGDIGHFGTATSATNYNTSGWATIPLPVTYHSDGFTTAGDSIISATNGKFIISAQVNFDSDDILAQVELRVLKDNTTPLPVITTSFNNARGTANEKTTVTLITLDPSGTDSSSYKLQAQIAGLAGTVTIADSSGGFMIHTFSGGSGPQGPTGPTGAAGADGADGVGVDSVRIITDSLFVYYSNLVSENIGRVTGEDGVDGNVADSNDYYVFRGYTDADSIYLEVINRFTSVIQDTIAVASNNNYVDGVSFATGTGELSLTRSGLSTLSTSLDGRYITGNESITLSGDVTGAGTTAIGVTINSSAVEGSMLNNNVISGRTALTTGLVSTDEFMISDAGTVKRMDVSVLETYMQNNLTFGGEWTDNGTFLYPSETSDDIVIAASSQGSFGSELEVNGELTLYGGTSGELLRVVNSSDQERFSVSFNNASDYSAIKTASLSDEWYMGVNNAPEFYISDALPGTTPEFALDASGNLELSAYFNTRDDAGSIGPNNFAYFDANGQISVSPISKSTAERVTANKTLDDNDAYVHGFVTTGSITITLPASPATGQRYFIRYNITTGSITLDGNGNNIRKEDNTTVTSITYTFRTNDIVVYDGTEWVIFQ